MTNEALPAGLTDPRNSLSLRPHISHVVLELRGVLDAGTAGRVQDAVDAACGGQCRDVVIDLRRVTSIDMIACRELERVRSRQAKQGMQFLTVGSSVAVAVQCLANGAAVLLAGGARARRRAGRRSDNQARHCVDLPMRRAERGSVVGVGGR